jgi:hypothetical protein
LNFWFRVLAHYPSFAHANARRTGKPAAIAASVAKPESTPKKSIDSKSVERSARSDTTKEKKTSKDRSQSRGKAFLNTIRGKKEEVKEEAKETKDEVKEATTGEPAAAATTETPGMFIRFAVHCQLKLTSISCY